MQAESETMPAHSVLSTSGGFFYLKITCSDASIYPSLPFPHPYCCISSPFTLNQTMPGMMKDVFSSAVSPFLHDFNSGQLLPLLPG